MGYSWSFNFCMLAGRPDKGRYWAVTGVERGKIMAMDPNGGRRRFGRQHAGAFDACGQRRTNLAIGDAGADPRRRAGARGAISFTASG
jgi:hypothetical protein